MNSHLLRVLIAALVLVSVHAVNLGSPKISPGLKSSAQQNPTDIIISFTQGTDDVLRNISGTPFPNRSAKLQALVSALVQNSINSQGRCRTFLLNNGHLYDELWVQDQLFVKQVAAELIEQIAAFPEVSKITENELTIFRAPLSDSSPSLTHQSRKGGAAPLAEWGVDRVKAEQAIELLKLSGTPADIRVATIDSGVRGTHEALRDNFMGQYGWFDPVGRSSAPYDDGGHGTHTTGTLAGSMGIGVYPDAKWMACVGCEDTRGFCSLYAMTRCGQWVLCPTLTDGNSIADCSKAPHLVSNSWGVTDLVVDWYDGVIAAWNVGGILPVFSMGNSGPSCSTTGYPGRGDVIGVGSTTNTDAISSFSSRGPRADGRMKPDISAPGSNIVSASHLSDTGYRSLSGTSMSCPHAAGVTGILLAYNPDLTFEQITEALNEGADTVLNTSGASCGGVPDTTFPNNVFGHGLTDALKSLEFLLQQSRA